MRTRTNQPKAAKPIKPQADVEKFVEVKTFGQQLEQCGGLSQEQIATVRGWILNNLQKADELFYTRIGTKKNEYVFVEAIVNDLLLHPATYFEKWPALNLKQQKQEIINLNQKAKDLDRWLQNISSNVAMLYEHKPETVESYLMHLQNLISQIKNNTEFFGHNLEKNPYYPFVKRWCDALIILYPLEKLTNRINILRSFMVSMPVEPSFKKRDTVLHKKQYNAREDNLEGNISVEKELENLRVAENRFWKGLPMDIVVSHFLVMTERKSRNGESFLTIQQLVAFLKRGFLKNEQAPIQKFNCSKGEKGFIVKRFYELFDIAASSYYYPQNKTEFIKLFTYCFQNWTEEQIIFYFKPGKIKQRW